MSFLKTNLTAIYAHHIIFYIYNNILKYNLVIYYARSIERFLWTIRTLCAVLDSAKCIKQTYIFIILYMYTCCVEYHYSCSVVSWRAAREYYYTAYRRGREKRVRDWQQFIDHRRVYRNPPHAFLRRSVRISLEKHKYTNINSQFLANFETVYESKN
jgi:hypothetical protein